MGQPLKFLLFIRQATWAEILGQWKSQEAHQSGWIRHYRRRGYRSWAAWRSAQFAPLKPERWAWRLYRVIDPLVAVPRWRGGPFRGWRRDYYGGRPWITLARLATNKKIQRHIKIRQIQRRWPKRIYFVGILSGHHITIIDGMHRACAIALSAREHQPVHGAVYVYLMRRHKPLGDLSTPIVN